MTRPQPRPLNQLLTEAGLPAGPAPETVVHDIVTDSRAVTPGALFVAGPGTKQDGRRFIDDAVRAGAAAVIMEADAVRSGSAPHRIEQTAPAARPCDALTAASGAAIPLLRVPSARRAVAHLAGSWYGQPARRMQLLGITGTVGKTSVLSIVEDVLRTAGMRVGSIGSLGLCIDGTNADESGYTVPEPLLLHRWLAHAADAGCGVMVMEVTSHALVQQRIAGLTYAGGAFTSLVPLEHAEFHGSFRSYVEAKTSFFDHLAPAAPLAYNADDRAVARVTRARNVSAVGCGALRTAGMRIEDVHVTAEGTAFVLHGRRPIPRADGSEHAPFRLPLTLSLLGRSNLVNAAIAAALSISAGANADDVRRVLPTLTAPRRRMHLIRTGSFLVLDDTVGHPDSVSVVFETVAQLAPKRVHIAWAVRGLRGPRINRYNAEALAIWAQRIAPATLVITRSADTADPRNAVTDAEYDAFLRPLRRARVAFTESDALAPAVQNVVARAEPGDLVLLLGAQGMDRGATIAADWLRTHRQQDSR